MVQIDMSFNASLIQCNSVSNGNLRRDYPICGYSDSYTTPLGANWNVSLYNINDSITEGYSSSNAGGCVNITVLTNESDDLDTLEIRYNGTGYKKT